MKIIIRDATEIEIVLPEGVEPPTVQAAESRHPSVTTRSAASAANPSCEAAASASATHNSHHVGHAEGAVAAPAVASHDTGPDSITLRLATVGDRVRAAVANPPPPEVDLPAELPLRRPVEDTLDLPTFLDRRKGSAHG